MSRSDGQHGNNSAGIAGRIIAFTPGSTVEVELLRFDAHLRVTDIHQAEWYGTLFCAHFLNSPRVNSFIMAVERGRGSAVYVDSVVYTDRDANLRRSDFAWNFYEWNLRRMYDSELRVEHLNRQHAAHREVNEMARFARIWPLDGIRWLGIGDYSVRLGSFEPMRRFWRDLCIDPPCLPQPLRRNRNVRDLLR